MRIWAACSGSTSTSARADCGFSNSLADNLGRYPDDPRLTDEERTRFLDEQPLLDRA